MARVKILLLVICFWIAEAEAATLRIPVVMRMETRMVTTNAFLLVNANPVNAPLQTWTPKTLIDRSLGDFLKTASGPTPEKAAASIAQPPPGSDSLPPATLLKVYQGLLKMPDRRILFSMDVPGGTLFFWKTSEADGRMARVAATLVKSEAGTFKVSAPSDDDNMAYLLVRSLQAASESGQLDGIMKPVSSPPSEAGYRVFDVAPGAQLSAKVSVFERATPLSCTGARNSAAALFVGCWITGTAFEPAGLSWLSPESQSRLKQWLPTLSAEAIKQLKALPTGPAFQAVVFDVGPLAVVFPSILSPVLGNKRSVYVSNTVPQTIVNFFSADFADEIFLSAYQQTLQNQAK
jgi:hypothetical protein